MGGWQIPVSSYVLANHSGKKCDGTPGTVNLTPGHAVMALWFSGGDPNEAYLHRNAIPGKPELNRMNTTIDMNSNDIDNAKNIGAETVATTGRMATGEYLQIDGQAVENAACSPNGLVGRNSAGMILSCQSGVWIAAGGAPPGMVGYFYANACPTGWLAANGANGTPDLRGVFLRSLDSGRGVDPGRSLGSWQGDAIRDAYGSGSIQISPQPYWEVSASGVFSVRPGSYYGSTGHNSWSQQSAIIDYNLASGGPVANENRPVNVAVLACIKS